MEYILAFASIIDYFAIYPSLLGDLSKDAFSTGVSRALFCSPLSWPLFL